METPIKLKVKSRSVETRIPVNGEIYYQCTECQDTGRIETQTAPDDSIIQKCPFCWRGEEPDMTGADGGNDR